MTVYSKKTTVEWCALVRQSVVSYCTCTGGGIFIFIIKLFLKLLFDFYEIIILLPVWCHELTLKWYRNKRWDSKIIYLQLRRRSWGLFHSQQHFLFINYSICKPITNEMFVLESSITYEQRQVIQVHINVDTCTNEQWILTLVKLVGHVTNLSHRSCKSNSF